jgi:protein-disulfide isomerase
MSQTQSRLTIPVGADDHAQGPADAPVTLVEYGDFECPYCGAAYPVIARVQQRMGDRLRFVFRQFPIATSHPHAEAAAEASEAAGAQGKFWEMHARLYEHQDALGDADLRRYAEAIGLDLGRFDREMADRTWADRVREQFMGGVRSGVNGTPTFYINGARYDGSWQGEDQLVQALEEAAGW